MKLNLSFVLPAATAVVCSAAAAETSKPALSFGKHYAVLNLDLLNGVIATVNTTQAGKDFINSTATWIDAVHRQCPPPLSFFTRIYFANLKKPEVAPDIPFYPVVQIIGNATEDSTISEIYPAFKPLKNYDVVLQKVRYYAGAGNALEEILSTQKIDTVILSGITTTGVVLSTAYRLFDLDYRVIVISNNTLMTGTDAKRTNDVLLESVLPALPVEVVTVEEAIAALSRSGPAVY